MNVSNRLFIALLASMTVLSSCVTGDMKKKELNIVFITDHVVGANDASNADLKALLQPIEPGTDHVIGFIPEIQVLRTDVEKENMEVLDLSTWRDNIPFLPQGSFEYVAGLRRNKLEEISKPFTIETTASNGLKMNLDSLVKIQFPDALVIQYGTRPLSEGNFFTNMDTLQAFLNAELYKADFDASKQIVIVYKAKEPGPEPVAMKSEPKSYTVLLDKASFTDCHTLTWPNGSEGVNYKISWSNYEQRLGSSTYFQIPEQYRSRKLNVTLCAYANGYDSVIQCAQRLYKPCPPAAVQAPRMNTPIAAEEPVGDMGLRILKEGPNRGRIQWVQRKGYVYRISINRSDESNSTFIENLLYSTIEGTIILDRNDPKIKNYIKNDAAHTFELRAYKLDLNSGKEVFQACRMLPALSYRTVGLNSGVGFTDSYCNAQRVDNKLCNN
jgi:hypothetical protein